MLQKGKDEQAGSSSWMQHEGTGAGIDNPKPELEKNKPKTYIESNTEISIFVKRGHKNLKDIPKELRDIKSYKKSSSAKKKNIKHKSNKKQ